MNTLVVINYNQPKFMTVSSHKYSNNYLNLFEWIDRVEIKQVKTARLILKLIPAQCPFARKLKMFDRVILTIFKYLFLIKITPSLLLTVTSKQK
jgi:hypothetical protein